MVAVRSNGAPADPDMPSWHGRPPARSAGGRPGSCRPPARTFRRRGRGDAQALWRGGADLASPVMVDLSCRGPSRASPPDGASRPMPGSARRRGGRALALTTESPWVREAARLEKGRVFGDVFGTLDEPPVDLGRFHGDLANRYPFNGGRASTAPRAPDSPSAEWTRTSALASAPFSNSSTGSSRRSRGARTRRCARFRHGSVLHRARDRRDARYKGGPQATPDGRVLDALDRPIPVSRRRQLRHVGLRARVLGPQGGWRLPSCQPAHSAHHGPDRARHCQRICNGSGG